MKLLVDECLQYELIRLLAEAGHDAIHVLDLGIQGAPDETVLAAACDGDRILVTADTDFGTMLALSNAAGPSVILLRRSGRRAAERAQIILTVLTLVEEQLRHDAVVTVERSRLRIRELPIDPDRYDR